MKNKNILILCAHSDDQVFGPGGTLAKYSREGAKVKSIIFSYGEKTHPHFKPEVIQKIREKESVDADKIIGGSGIEILGLIEGKFKEEIKHKQKRLNNLIKKFKPDVIFTHLDDDPHPDHRAVYEIALNTYNKLGLTCPVYGFEVWNLFSLKKHDEPRYVVDISDTFRTKMDALLCFKSQINPLSIMILNNFLYLGTVVRAFFIGIKHDCRFAESFKILR